MRKDSGFTLIELLIVVTIIGLIAAMAIPNLISAVDKAKQRKTMGDMRQLGSAVEMYAVDNNTYPRVANYSALQPLITPNYVKTVSGTDGWNHPWVFTGDTTNGTEYTLTSLGKDGKPGVSNGGETTGFNCDIIFSNGQFFQWPSGTQT
ncbi:MAG TPA: type II secretion system protein GspG [Candidatus Polarisedimenticolia bacterium]|nr:type II secretion system protein GspG [Candidatus Polarisedimenticolia bacterium]